MYLIHLYQTIKLKKNIKKNKNKVHKKVNKIKIKQKVEMIVNNKVLFLTIIKIQKLIKKMLIIMI